MKISARRFGILSSSSLVSATLGKIFIPGRGFLGKTVSAAAAVRSAVRLEHRQATRVRQPAGIAAALWGALWGGSALAGGYVAPILELAPAAPVATAGTSPNWWMALVPLFLFALAGRADRGDNGLTPLPGDYGGPCFGEDTLIPLERGWVPVQRIEAGERMSNGRRGVV